MGKPVTQAVLDTPIPKQADIVTQPPTGLLNPSTGQPDSVLRTGIDPTQLIGNVAPQAENPIIVDAAAGGDNSERAAVGTVKDTSGGR